MNREWRLAKLQKNLRKAENQKLNRLIRMHFPLMELTDSIEASEREIIQKRMEILVINVDIQIDPEASQQTKDQRMNDIQIREDRIRELTEKINEDARRRGKIISRYVIEACQHRDLRTLIGKRVDENQIEFKHNHERYIMGDITTSYRKLSGV